MSGGFLYDLVVIGGGSGGMAAAKEAARLGARTAIFDFVKPTPHGTQWGLGGTCVNVGCVPKKLMHYAALAAPILHSDAPHLGWNGTKPSDLQWNTLVKTVQMHIKKLNFGYKTGLRSNKVEYINALASFVKPNTLTYSEKGNTKEITAKYIIIATGGRPAVPDNVPGAADLAITSDDIFSWSKPPGKTLIVGGSYIALECAGFLTHLGFDVTTAVRSILLRGFDRQCSEKVGALMKELGTKFQYGNMPISLEKTDNDQILVTFNDGSKDSYDTVIYAAGRAPDIGGLNLKEVDVATSPAGKIQCNADDSTTAKGIYAIGDVVEDRPELTPVAIKTGELLAARLFGNSRGFMSYDSIPTTVFTPVEYGKVGLSEEKAREIYGAEGIDVYLFEFTTLEWAAAHREKVRSERINEFDVDLSPNCLSKVIVRKDNQESVVGIHFVGPNAGEVIQGFAVAFRKGLVKADLDNTVGVHPTDAESFCSLSVLKSSGESWVAAGGCGGGKCG